MGVGDPVTRPCPIFDPRKENRKLMDEISSDPADPDGGWVVDSIPIGRISAPLYVRVVGWFAATVVCVVLGFAAALMLLLIIGAIDVTVRVLW